MHLLAQNSAFVGRDADLARLKAMVRGVSDGRGHAVWVEGEPGIGKTSLVNAALDGATAAGCTILRTKADELDQRSPLRVLLGCFGISPESTDPRRAEIAALLRNDTPPAAVDFSDPASRASERLLSLVDELCADAPLIVVVDDMQWADEASLRVWQHLAQTVRQLPLLLIATCRPVGDHTAVSNLRHRVLSRDGIVLSLAPLPGPEISDLVHEVVRAQPGPALLQLVSGITGNPLYLREIVQALFLEDHIRVQDGHADLAGLVLDRMPASLESAIARRLEFLAPELRELLGSATLLGQEFSVGDLAVVRNQTPLAMLTLIRQAISAGVVEEKGERLRFSHPVIHQVLHDSIPESHRATLHRQAAQALARADAAPERVAEQLLAGRPDLDEWTVQWAATHGATLTSRAPQLAAHLLELVVGRISKADTVGHGYLESILTQLAQALFRLGRNAEAERRVRQVLARTQDQERAGELRWSLARVLLSAGDDEGATEVIRQSLDTPLTPVWRGRLLSLSAMSARAATGDLDNTDALAQEAMATAARAEDRFGMGYALCIRWLVASIRRDHAAALSYVDRALSLLHGDPSCRDLRAWALDNRVFTLQNLDQLSAAADTLKQALAEAERSGDGSRETLHIGAAVYYFWRGRWDDAVAALDSMEANGPQFTHFGLREDGPVHLYHGVGAYIAGHRDRGETAVRHITAASTLTLESVAQWENSDFLIAARSLRAERDGDTQQAAAILATLLHSRPGQMMLVHQWLADLVRLALMCKDENLAHEATEVCECEAARETRPARANSAAEHCRGLVANDPDRVLAAAQHYRDQNRSFELARSLEDVAVLLAQRGFTEDARSTVAEATQLYATFGADWDIRRANARIRALGIRQGVRGPHKRPSHGWDALTPAELSVARLVAQGRSNPDIARFLQLSRRTVEAHVSHVLRKLSVYSRSEIANLTLRHPGATSQHPAEDA